MKNLIAFGLLLAALPALAAPVDFNKDVAPILRQYCAGCHNHSDLEGEFSVETFKSLMRGGANGKGILPGEAEKSLLVQLITKQKEPLMPPPSEPQPTPKQLATLQAWITQGAKGPTDDRSILSTLSVPMATPATTAQRPITALSISHDNQLAVAAFKQVQVGDRVLTDHPGKVNAVAFSPDGRWLAAATGVAGLRGEALLWDLKNGARVGTFATGHRDTLYGVAFSPDGATLATAGYDRIIQLWDRKTGKLLRTLEGHNGPVHDIAFSPDGEVIVSAGGDSSVKLWNTNTGQRLDTMGQSTGEQFSAAFTPNGKHVVAAGADKQIRLWKWLSKNKPQINPLVLVRFAHEDEITTLAISPSGTRIASASADLTVKTWSLPDLRMIQTFADQPDVVSALAFSPDGKSLHIGRMDGSLQKLEMKDHQPQTSVAQNHDHRAIASDRESVKLTESEPNNDPSTAAAIKLPATITGAIHGSDDIDSDLYRFSAKAGEQWVFEINAARSKSPMDSKIEILDDAGQPIERVRLQAIRQSWLTFRGKDSSTSGDFRLFKWDEMTVNQLLYVNGEVAKLWHYPRGPDSGYLVYPGTGSRYGFFDTTPLAHPLGQPAYIVEPISTSLPPLENGLPIFTVYYENDDESRRRLGKDSKLTFTAPKDGSFIARVSDIRGYQGKDYNYTLTVRPRRGDFSVSLAAPADIPLGGGREFSVTATRIDDYDGPIRVDITDVPAGFQVTTPLVIEAGQRTAFGAIYAVPVELKPVEPAIRDLNYKLYHGSWSTIPDWSKLKPEKTGTIKTGVIDLSAKIKNDQFGFLFEGTIDVSKDGAYEFYLASDDGSQLFIDGIRIVDNDGLHGTIRKSGQVNLKAGPHAIRVSYIEAAGQEELYVGWKGPGFGETSLSNMPAAKSLHAKVTATAVIDGKQVTHPVNNLTGLKSIPKPKLLVRVAAADGKAPEHGTFAKPMELTAAPGETISARVFIERNGFAGRVSFGNHDSGRNLPHGVYVDNIGLSGLLIVEGQTEREFFITVDKWVPETTRLFHIRTTAEKGIVSQPVLLHIRKK